MARNVGTSTSSTGNFPVTEKEQLKITKSPVLPQHDFRNSGLCI